MSDTGSKVSSTYTTTERAASERPENEKMPAEEPQQQTTTTTTEEAADLEKQKRKERIARIFTFFSLQLSLFLAALDKWVTSDPASAVPFWHFTCVTLAQSSQRRCRRSVLNSRPWLSLLGLSMRKFIYICSQWCCQGGLSLYFFFLRYVLTFDAFRMCFVLLERCNGQWLTLQSSLYICRTATLEIFGYFWTQMGSRLGHCHVLVRLGSVRCCTGKQISKQHSLLRTDISNFITVVEYDLVDCLSCNPGHRWCRRKFWKV